MNELSNLEFTPMKGILGFGRRLAHQFGFGHLWDGEEGIESVARQKLEEMGVPKGPVKLAGDQAAMTPRQFAEHVKFIKRRKR